MDEERQQLMEAVQSLADSVGDLVDAMSQDPANDLRWVGIAYTNLQTGFMALKRSIAQPEGF
jgi:hypothetical protein